MNRVDESSLNWFVADFETTSYKYYQTHGDSKVWLWAICDEKAQIIKYGDSIDTFFNFISSMRRVIIYFHNLKFDGQFIISWLLMNGFTHKDKLNTKSKKAFSTLIGEMGEFYQIKINWGRDKQVIIQDSLKVLPFKVEKIADDFDLEIKKGKIDYEDYIINDEKLDYIFNDVKIVAQALAIIKQEGITKMTTASSAYFQFKNSNIFCDDMFPNLDKEFLNEWRNCYRGGRSMVNPIHQNKILNNVKRFDINSMYPYVMHDCFLPYGKPIEIKQKGKFKFELYKINVDFRLKKNHLPSLLKKGTLYGGEDSYYYNTNGIESIYISSIDYELLERNYDILYIEFEKMYGFMTCDFMFKNYIDKYYKLKSNSKGAKKVAYKLMLNSLYGKFGSKCEGYSKIPCLNDNKVLTYKNSKTKDMKHYYLPVAIAITSYAHKLLDDAIYLTGIDKFVYCDTDSIHTLGTLPTEMIDNKKLGKFKLEGVEKISKYVRQKCYIIKEYNKDKKKDEITVTCAGMPSNIKDYIIKTYGDNLFELFKVGFKCEGKLLPKKVKGGVILENTTFEIKR